MAKRSEVGLVYLSGLAQGLALVTFPAASSIFTRPHPQGYGLSSAQYGALFVPQVVLAILASARARTLARAWKLNRVLLLAWAATWSRWPCSQAVISCCLLQTSR